MTRIRADFNGLFGDLLCLSHSETATDEGGTEVRLISGMVVTVFDEDTDSSGKPDDLVATGVVEEAPDWLSCKGSRWVLRIDTQGVRHESEIRQVDFAVVYVYLLDEGTDVWRPVQARKVADDCYQLVSVNSDPVDEQWEFNTGDVVRCKTRRLSGGDRLVAYELVQRSA